MLHFFPRNSKQFYKNREEKKLKEPSRKKFRSNLETKLKNVRVKGKKTAK